MSLLQRTGVYQKTDHWHPAFRSSGVMTSDVSEVTEIDEDVLIHARDAPRLVPDDVLEPTAATAYGQVITKYVDSEKWCGDQRTKYAVLKVEATSFVLAVICVALALVLVSVMFPNEFSLIGP
jgi:5,10-methylene-tetrahydrofolate dehydrogenase/methenyl tetrahydrofolate cyclohydrolase